MIPDETINRIQQANPLADVIREAGIELKQVGAELKGLCPFHDDHHPSLSVNEVKNVFLCRACGKGGDVLKWVRLREGLTFQQAAGKLARRAGIPLNDDGPAKAKQPVAHSKQTAAKVAAKPEHDLSADWHQCVEALSDAEVERIAQWRDYSVEFVRWLRKRECIGLFNGKVAFPVHDKTGRVVGIHYRLEPEHEGERVDWRYKGGCKAHPLVFGNPKTAGCVSVFESQWDAFVYMDQIGWHETEPVAEAIIITRSCDNGKLIKGLCAPDARVLAFKQNDGAEDGKKAGRWLKDVVKHAGCKVMLVATPEPHKDLNDWKRAGATREEIIAAIATAVVVAPQAETAPVSSSPMGTPQNPVELAAQGNPLARSDMGLAERFAFYHHGDAVYQSDAGVWLVWDGKRWQPDHNLVEIRRLMMQTARKIQEECAVLPPSLSQETRLQHFKFALRCEAKERIAAAIALAPSVGMAKPLDAFDRDPLLFNVSNGTIDLRTGTLRPHSRQDLLTKLSPVCFTPGLCDEVFEKFISHITGHDPELAVYLQRAAGYTLTGLIGEKCLFIVFSLFTDTGKSTFVEGLLAAMGDYGMTLDFETLLETEHKGSNPRYDLAKLRGVRLAVSAETKPGRRFSAEIIKRLTGGDTIRAREIHQSSIEFPPTHKLWLATNHAPMLEDGGDEATWNRLRRVPFNNQIPREQRNPKIKAALENPESSTCAALLAWAVAGCVAWQKAGLGTAQAVEDSIAEYRKETDPLAEFVDDQCFIGSSAQCTAQQLRQAYESWCTLNSVRYPLGKPRFAACIRRYGAQDGKTTGGKRVWRGIGVLDTSGVSGVSGVDLGVNPSGESLIANFPQIDPCYATAATENERQTI